MSKYKCVFEKLTAGVPVVTKSSGYLFKKFPFGEESMFIDAALIKAFLEWTKTLSFNQEQNIHAVASPEPGGLPWAMLLAGQLDLNIIPIRLSRNVNNLLIENHYSSKRLNCGVKGKNQSVILFDDVLSSGETIVNCIQELKKQGFLVEDVIVLCARNKAVVRHIELTKSVQIHVLMFDNAYENTAKGHSGYHVQ